VCKLRCPISVSMPLEIHEHAIEMWGKGYVSEGICDLIHNEWLRRKIEQSTILPAMTEHIKAAVAAGKYRGEAEQDFGQAFPDELWRDLGGRNGRARPEDY
jgi:hypothetical protein